MPISVNFTSIFQQDWEINFLQCYSSGFLKYTSMCDILQLTAGYHAELGGISYSDMQNFNQAWVLSRMRIEIQRLPKWKEKVTVKTWINSLENSRSIRCLEMYIGTEKIVGCETYWAVFNTQTRRPENLAMPHKHFEKYPERATKNIFGKIDFQNNMKNISSHIVKLSDLDIVDHVNSAKYLEWCLDLVDYNIIQNQKIESIEMNYLKELSLNDNITIYQNTSRENLIFSILRNGKANFALQVITK